jgi:hypothetical protein
LCLRWLQLFRFFPIKYWCKAGGKPISSVKSLFSSCLLLENITTCTLVLAAFTFNFQVSQYKYIALRADCNSAAVSANITVSSAYSNKYNLKYTSISSLSNNKCEILQIFFLEKVILVETKLDLYNKLEQPCSMY